MSPSSNLWKGSSALVLMVITGPPGEAGSIRVRVRVGVSEI
jgi:hypothetical protein